MIDRLDRRCLQEKLQERLFLFSVCQTLHFIKKIANKIKKIKKMDIYDRFYD